VGSNTCLSLWLIAGARRTHPLLLVHRSRTASGKAAALLLEGSSDDDTHVSASCDPDFSNHLDDDSVVSSSDDDFESEPETPPRKRAKKV
jgi:hypothetical protein